MSARAILDGAVAHIPDVSADEQYTSVDTKKAGFRSLLAAPLLHGSKPIGSIVIFRAEPGAFTESQSTLLESFAAQAVIAIENARLFNETNQALARQTATAEILKIVASSPTDVKPVFDSIVRPMARVMRCDRAFFVRCEGDSYFGVATAALDGSFSALVGSTRINPAANFPSRAIISKQTVYYPDRSQIEVPEYERNISEKFGVNSSLFLPLLRQDQCIGVLALASKGTNAFSASDIALAESFRDQALIAIENARLFHETNEALAQQTATSEVLEVISSSMGNAQPVFEQMLGKATRVCGAEFGVMGLLDGEM